MRKLCKKIVAVITVVMVLSATSISAIAAEKASCGHKTVYETYYQTVSDTTTTHKYQRLIIGEDGTKTYVSADCSKRVWIYVNKFVCADCGQVVGYSSPKTAEFHSACGQ